MSTNIKRRTPARKSRSARGNVLPFRRTSRFVPTRRRACRQRAVPAAFAPAIRALSETMLCDPGGGIQCATYQAMRKTGRGLCAMSEFKEYVCVVCGFVYSEADGLPDEGFPPGTRWEDIPANWVCPECGAAKEDFEMVEI
jgi:rubredoxin